MKSCLWVLKKDTHTNTTKNNIQEQFLCTHKKQDTNITKDNTQEELFMDP